ncbi:hypothetical protein PUN28_003222 [Cardiocondyla obscurior]|uniref:Uncharacterized protein n=1 Tax=Cardiocondyla obscurior TaxID=286306 RepID=A0AAW2GMC2_9HYME
MRGGRVGARPRARPPELCLCTFLVIKLNERTCTTYECTYYQYMESRCFAFTQAVE